MAEIQITPVNKANSPRAVWQVYAWRKMHTNLWPSSSTYGCNQLYCSKHSEDAYLEWTFVTRQPLWTNITGINPIQYKIHAFNPGSLTENWDLIHGMKNMQQDILQFQVMRVMLIMIAKRVLSLFTSGKRIDLNFSPSMISKEASPTNFSQVSFLTY